MTMLINELAPGVSVNMFSIRNIVFPVEAYKYSVCSNHEGGSVLCAKSMVAASISYFGVKLGDTLYEALANIKHHQCMDLKLSKAISELQSENST